MLPFLTTLRTEICRALDRDVLKRDQVLLTFDQSSDFTNSPALDLSAIGQNTLLFVLDAFDAACIELFLRIGGIATGASCNTRRPASNSSRLEPSELQQCEPRCMVVLMAERRC